MATISTFLADALLPHGLGKSGGSYTQPTTYIALFTVNPTMPAGTGYTEVSGGSYARVALASLWGAASAGSMANSSLISFTTATGSWGTVTGVGIWDAITAGNLLSAGPLTTSKVIGTGDTFTMPIGDLDATLS